MKEKKIGLDLDGVLYPFQTICYTMIAQKHNYNMGEIEFWRRKRNSNRFYGKHREEIDAIVKEPNSYYRYSLIDYTSKILLNLKAMGMEFFYITARPEHIAPVTSMWLSNNVPDAHNLFIGHAEKKSIIEELNIDIYVDDRANIIEDVMSVTDAYLFQSSYLTLENVRATGLPYITSLYSLYNLVENL